MVSAKKLREESHRLVKLFASTPFEACLPLEVGFPQVSVLSGLYAFKMPSEDGLGEIVYVGKASSYKTRFGAHHILVRMFCERVDADNVRLLMIPIPIFFDRYLEILEKQVTFVLRPRYNKTIPRLDQIEALMQLRETPPVGKLQEVLDCLPEPVVEALENYAQDTGRSLPQTLEFAIAAFLNLEATSFGEIQQEPTPAQLKERLAIAEIRLAAAQGALAAAGVPDPSVLPNLPGLN